MFDYSVFIFLTSALTGVSGFSFWLIKKLLSFSREILEAMKDNTAVIQKNNDIINSLISKIKY